MSDAPGFDATAAATRIAELDVAIARADAAIEQAKAERTQIEEALLDYVAATGAVSSARTAIRIAGDAPTIVIADGAVVAVTGVVTTRV